MVAQRIVVFAPWMAIFDATKFASDFRIIPSFEIPEAVRFQRRTRRGDVHDGFRQARGRRALGRSKALDGAVVNDAVRCKKSACQVRIFRSDPHAAAMLRGEQRGRLFEIGHGLHVKPAIGNGDDDIGAAETEFQETGHALVGVGNLLPDEIFSRYAQMNAPRLEMTRDLTGRENSTAASGTPSITPR